MEMTEMGNATCPNNSNNNQPPAGYIWPTGYYPMHGNNHSANLIGAELYIQEQQMKAQQREEGREFAAKYGERFEPPASLVERTEPYM